MTASGFACVTIAVLSLAALALPQAGIEMEDWPAPLTWAFVAVILVGLFVLGRDDRRAEEAADPWVDDPRKSPLQNWLHKRRQRFDPARGLWFFLAGLVVFPSAVGIGWMFGEQASLAGAIAFVLIMSLLAGLVGMFTEKVPF